MPRYQRTLTFRRWWWTSLGGSQRTSLVESDEHRNHVAMLQSPKQCAKKDQGVKKGLQTNVQNCFHWAPPRPPEFANWISHLYSTQTVTKTHITCEIRDSASVLLTKWMELRTSDVDWSPKRTSPILSITRTWMYGSFGGVASCKPTME